LFLSRVYSVEYFGYGLDIVADLITKLPNADSCTKYKCMPLYSFSFLLGFLLVRLSLF
jgi:hypothetical protein